ncbi:MAG TPA: lipopolysaccharide heptosyltransferase II [Lentisphaeria bacterium]|nr:MAG: lipopolysaccharide heptosyltransferase II [Lentisphaerae bacterium GWF2_50_93]HCE46395.1 lipopolysaccharide heptosyltransferase II [Lentisphaeria bacterium]
MEKILIIKISSLGDVLHAFPAVSLLAEKFPEARIDWLVNPAFAPVLRYNRHVRRIIHFPRRELGSPLKFPSAFRKLLAELRSERYDMAIDLQGLLRSALFAKFAKADSVAGFSAPKEKVAALFYDRRLSPELQYVHAVEKNTRFISMLFDIPFSVPQEDLPEDSSGMKAVRLLLEKKGVPADGSIIAVAPGARWKSKQWPPAFFAEVMDKVHESASDSIFLLLGSRDEIGICGSIASACRKAKPVVIAGETGIGELVEALRISKCLLCNDSGPMHIAASLRKPVFAMFGPTDPGKTGPYGKGHAVFQPYLGCIKCLKRYCPRKNYHCHASVKTDLVAEKIISLVRSKEV